MAAAKRHGLEVHVWKVNFNLSTAPKVSSGHARQGRLKTGPRRANWLCPSHPENLKLEVDTMLEVARKYDVDGLHFDYIRSERRILLLRRLPPAVRGPDWPEGGPLARRLLLGSLKTNTAIGACEQITRLVKTVHQEAKKLKPTIKISAAVFSGYPSCRTSVGQDWPAWIKAGYLDFVCPMDYTQSDMSFTNMVASQMPLVDGRIPIYPGIGAWRLGSADRVVSQIQIARQLGAQGFTIFDLNEGAAKEIVPGIGLGAGAKKATRE